MFAFEYENNIKEINLFTNNDIVRMQTSALLDKKIMDNSDLINIKNSVDFDDIVKKEKTVLTFDEVLKKSFLYNFDIKNLENKKKLQNENIEYTKLGYLPNVSLSYSLNKTKKDKERDNIAYKDYKNAMFVNTNLNVYDFGARQTLINTYKNEKEISTLEICEEKNKTAVTILDIYFNIYKNRESIFIFKKLLVLYKKKI
jgi:outer membrane protein TolC